MTMTKTLNADNCINDNNNNDDDSDDDNGDAFFVLMMTIGVVGSSLAFYFGDQDSSPGSGIKQAVWIHA